MASAPPDTNMFECFVHSKLDLVNSSVEPSPLRGFPLEVLRVTFGKNFLKCASLHALQESSLLSPTAQLSSKIVDPKHGLHILIWCRFFIAFFSFLS